MITIQELIGSGVSLSNTTIKRYGSNLVVKLPSKFVKANDLDSGNEVVMGFSNNAVLIFPITKEGDI